jgi:hypothetical protein
VIHPSSPRNALLCSPEEGAATIPVTLTAAVTGGAWNVHASVDLAQARQSFGERP